jgi:copper chaperone NosL
MNKNKMRKTSRILIALASLVLIATYFFPVWFIFLIAPQYPEGLTMNIWLNKLSGQVEIINGLNHYIGMKHISAEMFPEFKFLVYIVAFFILFGLAVAIIGKRKLLFGYVVLTVIGGAMVIYDFYQWGYTYGHNLDPKAPIQVPGLYYQPPVIGHKRLLNFDAYSYPDIGGWIVIGVGTCFFLVWFFEWYKSRNKKTRINLAYNKAVKVAAALFILSLNSCTPTPAKIDYGKDNCSDCSMTIMDPRFASEIITKKGKVYKFDDTHCIIHFLKSGKIRNEDIAKTVFLDFNNKDNFVDASYASFVYSPDLKSPMNGNTIAVSSATVAAETAKTTSGTVKNWNELLNQK